MGTAVTNTGHMGRGVSFNFGRPHLRFGDLRVDHLEGHAEQTALPEFNGRADDACGRRAVHAAPLAKPPIATVALHSRIHLATAEVLAKLGHTVLRQLGLRRHRLAAMDSVARFAQ